MKTTLFTLAATLMGLASAGADTYAIFSRSTSGTRTSSFAADILRIPAEFSSKKVTYNYHVIRNLSTTPVKEAYLESFVIGKSKFYYVNQATPGVLNTTRFTPVPSGEDSLDLISPLVPTQIKFALYRSSAATSADYLTDASRPYFERNRLNLLQLDSGGNADLTINDQFSILGTVANVSLPTANTIIRVPLSFTGSGLNNQIHALRDDSVNVRDYKSSEVICFGFSEKWKLNVGLSDKANGGTGSGGINPGTDAWAVSQVINSLEKAGYNLAP